MTEFPAAILYSVSMQRFFVNPSCIQADRILIDAAPLLHQMNRVLRLNSGERVIFLDNTGAEYEAVLEKLGEKMCEAKILEKRKNMAEPEIFLTLYQALPKKRELFEWVLQKGTEIGVSAFVPLVTERTERREIGNPERLERILQEAAEQCGRGKIPVLLPAVTLKEMLEYEKAPSKILLHTDIAVTLRQALGDKVSKVALAVGPEGGFSENEATLAKNTGWQIASLGPRVLRTETAGIIGAALLLL